MTRYRITLEPTSPFFVGMGSHARKSGAVIHSDTLHAALMAVAALAMPKWLDEAQRLRVSSIFPYWKSIFFYPRPFLPVPRQEGNGAQDADDDGKQRKRWKKIRLISEGMLHAWLKADPGLSDKTQFLEGGFAALNQELNGLKPPRNPFIARDLAPAVTVDRCTAGATPYERRGIRVNTREGVGLWFLAELEDLQAASFRDLVELLGAHGLGGERSVGYGHFEVLGIEPAPQEGPLAPVANPDAAMTISLYHPTAEETAAGVLDGIAAYDCAVRGGWIHSIAGADCPKHALRMCLEGSVFPVNGAAPHGDVKNVAPPEFTEHPVWRSGLALTLPFEYPQEIRRITP